MIGRSWLFSTNSKINNNKYKRSLIQEKIIILNINQKNKCPKQCFKKELTKWPMEVMISWKMNKTKGENSERSGVPTSASC